jgi:hypothetical protein
LLEHLAAALTEPITQRWIGQQPANRIGKSGWRLWRY